MRTRLRPVLCWWVVWGWSGIGMMVRLEECDVRGFLGTTLHTEYRSIQTKVNNVTHRRCNTSSVPNGVGARGRAFGLRNSEIAFPRTVHIGNVTCVASGPSMPMEINKFSQTNKIIKKIWILWLTSITPSGIITELSQIIVFEKQTIKKNFRKIKLTVDKRQKIW